MKTNTISTRIFSLGIALAIVALTLPASAAQQGSARVIKLKGAARYSTGNNVWLPLSVGTVLKPGAVIQTASESTVDLALNGDESVAGFTPVVNSYNPKTGSSGSAAVQNVVRLRENTLLAIDRLAMEQTGADTVTDTELDLRSGRIFGNVKKTSAASRYEIKLPNGVAGIRGTIYDVSAGGILTVYVGSVVLTYLNPSNPNETITKVINAGQQYDLNNDNFIPVPAGALQDAQAQAKELSQGGETTQTTTFIKDNTIIYISPVVGDNTQPSSSGGSSGGPPVPPS